MNMLNKKKINKMLGICMTAALTVQTFASTGVSNILPKSTEVESYVSSEKFSGKNGDINVTRTIKKIVDGKNTWDVEMKVEGSAPKINETADIVLVLDRSESMKKITPSGEMRGSLVRDAAIEFAESLLSEENVNVSVVSFGSFNPNIDGDIPAEGLPSFNDGWGEIYVKKIENTFGLWPEYTLETDFTSNKNTIKDSISNCMTEANYYGGTPTSIGILKAGKMLSSSNADNKSIVLISDGPASYKRNGGGHAIVDENNPASWQIGMMNDTLYASDQSHERIPDLQFFTVAVGDDMHEKTKEFISDCATPVDGYAHIANDTEVSLDESMNKIETSIKSRIGGKTVLEEIVKPYITIQSATKDFLDSVVALDSTNQVDWNTTSAAITQGTVDYADDKSIKWNLGDLKAGVPAIIRYRISLEDANIGEKRGITNGGKLKFLSNANKFEEGLLPDLEVDLDWIKVIMQTGYSDTYRIIPDSETIVWYKIPETSTSSMTFGYNTKYNKNKLEVDNSADTTVRDALKLPVDIEINTDNVSQVMINNVYKEYDIMDTNSMQITKSPNRIVTLLKRVQSADVERTVTEVEDEKNVWEVELKVTGTTTADNVPTDVVLVLDRSGSMAIRNMENVTRGQNVLTAAKNLADTLLQQPNINVAAVSFGGFKVGLTSDREPIGADGYIPESGLTYFDADWDYKMLSKADKGTGTWAQATVDCGFTDNPDMLKKGLEEGMHWNNIYGGTPISIGMIEAGKMLEESPAANKVIILLSDGMPSFSRDGRGPGGFDEENPDTWDWNSINDTIKVGEEAHERIPGLKLFTIAAGNTIVDKGKEILRECATTDEYVYSAEDTLESLNAAMNSIANTIIGEIATEPVLKETIVSELDIVSPSEDIKQHIKAVEVIDKELGTTDIVDWSNTSVAVTQGNINMVNNNSFTWDIGKVSPKQPAIVKYRVNMKEGDVGYKYEVSTDSDMKYIGAESELVNKDVPNAEVELSWVELNLSTYDYETFESVPESDITLWQKVPDGFTSGDMNFNYTLKYDSSTLEVGSDGDKTVESSVKVPIDEYGNPGVVVGVLVDEKMYTQSSMKGVDGSPGASISKTPTKVTSLVNEPEITSVTNSERNFIQPEGVTNVSSNIKFNVESKDVSYTVDTTDMINRKLGGYIFIYYDRDNQIVEVTKVNESDKVLVEGVDYISTQSGNSTTIQFIGEVNPGDEFRIDIYMPTKFRENAVYGGSGAETYLNKYYGKKEQVDTIIKTTPKVGDITLEDGSVDKVYGNPMVIDSKDKPENKVTLTYIDIAGIS